MSTINKLSGAVRLALLAGATSFLAGQAFAQTTEAASTDEKKSEESTLETITVTGTRIQSQTVTASSPVIEIEREEFQFSGATRVDDLVNQYPQMSPYFDSFANNGAVGYPTVNLRGLGSARTLTLVNGNRLAPGPNEVRDISIIPAALVQRVDILTGGASAVYGSDAVAGVVNFVLDTEFEGVSLSAGYSAYQHDNDNSYLQGLMDARDFTYPTGGSGLDGIARNIDIAMGSAFADGAGHAMAWLTWRENDELYHGDRDYSSCALNARGTACGGSGTAIRPNFFIMDSTFDYVDYAHLNADGSWAAGLGEVYNYAPPNFYQRPDERYTFGTSLKYEVNEHFKPYLETMFLNRANEIQVAESGTFFADLLTFDCSDPLLGSMCADLGLNTSGPVYAYVGKRNVEGGPRNFKFETNSFRVVGGAEGAINDNWSYNVSFLYGHTGHDEQGTNDFLSDRVVDALLGCPSGSFSGCLPYNVWVPGGVTAEAAAMLGGVRMTKTSTTLSAFNAYASGDLGFGFASAGDENVSLVAGVEWRKEEYDFTADSNSQAGNFTGAGGPALPLSGQTKVGEFFLESAVPLLTDAGFIDRLALDLGYRFSDYDLSGTANTYKIGFGADIAGDYRVRGGFNHAIRAPGTGELFSTQQIALWSGTDPCAGDTPVFTLAQCQNTGVTAAQYGHIVESPAGQYNQFTGGNTNLKPEEADTWTLGMVAQPIENLSIAVDYFDISLEDTISTIGAATLLEFCGLTGDPFLCDRINRNAATGDLWLGNNVQTSGHVVNLVDNFGEQHYRGLDLGVSYGWDILGGRLATSMQGTYLLEEEIAPLPGVNDDATYDCKGKINLQCQSPEWRHIATVRFSRDWYTANMRWRHYGSVDYVDSNGVALTRDTLLAAEGGIGGYNYLDVSGSILVGDGEFTVGLNNVFDREPPMVGNEIAANANAPGGYDQAGRYFFTSFTYKF